MAVFAHSTLRATAGPAGLLPRLTGHHDLSWIGHHSSLVAHRCVGFIERTFLRALMLTIGTLLVIIGLGLCATIIMLPAGVVVAGTGAGLIFWGTIGNPLPVDD